MNISDELKHALSRSRAWRQHRCTLDCGSYCESAEPAAVAASKILKAYDALADELLAFERAGYKQPSPVEGEG